MNRKQSVTLVALIGLLALWLLPAATPHARAADAQWRARYWNNRNLSGNAIWERNEDAIDHDWGGGSPTPPLIGDDNFSARWNRVVNFNAGTYRFSATMDDGMRAVSYTHLVTATERRLMPTTTN